MDILLFYLGNYVLYWSFDTLDGLTLWDLSNQHNYSADVDGKVKHVLLCSAGEAIFTKTNEENLQEY